MTMLTPGQIAVAVPYLRRQIRAGLSLADLPGSLRVMVASASVLEPSARTWSKLDEREGAIIVQCVATWQAANGLVPDGQPGPRTQSSWAWHTPVPEQVDAWCRVLALRNPDAPPSVLREVVDELITQATAAGLEHAVMFTMLGLGETEAGFVPAAGWERGGNGAVGVWQQKPDYAKQWMDAGWEDKSRAQIRDELRNNPRHQTRAFVRWMRHRWRTGEDIASRPPRHRTFRDQAQANADTWADKGSHWTKARDVEIPGPGRKNAWLAHYNRGSNGAGRDPDFDAPNRPDGSAYQLKAERKGAEIRRAVEAT